MRKAIIWVAVAVAVVVGIGYLLSKPAGGMRVVDSAGVTAAQQKGAQVIDVRTQGEYDLGHIPGAKNVPVDTIAAAAANWDRNATYVVYCATGVRSAEAVKILTSMGFKNIDHFSAGFNGWTGKIESGSATAAPQTIPTSGKPVVVEFYTDS
jgi:rhodanese-related sulfurtransferase